MCLGVYLAHYYGDTVSVTHRLFSLKKIFPCDFSKKEIQKLLTMGVETNYIHRESNNRNILPKQERVMKKTGVIIIKKLVIKWK